MQRILFSVSLTLGVMIAYIDSRPMWDDTGITAGMLCIAGGIMGFLGPNRPWLWALLLSVWIPILGIIQTGNWASALAIVVAFIGSYSGFFWEKWNSSLNK